MSDETAIGWIREVVRDSPDPWALARFWAACPLRGGSTGTGPGTRSAWWFADGAARCGLTQAQAGLPTPGTGRPSSR